MEERGLTPLLEQVFSLYRLPTLSESPQCKRLPGLSVTLITGGKKERGGSYRQLSNDIKVSVSAEHLSFRKLTSRWLSSKSTRTSRSKNTAWTLRRNPALTAGSPLEQPASEQSLSPSFSSCPSRERHPTPPSFGAAGATLRVRAIPSARRAD